MRQLTAILLFILSAPMLFSQSATELYGKGNDAAAAGEYQRALEYYKQAEEIFDKAGSRYNQAFMLQNIGTLLRRLGSYEDALKCFLQSLNIHEELGDDEGIVEDSNHLGQVYSDLGKYNLAIDYYNRALLVIARYGWRALLVKTMNNIGIVYYAWGFYERALEYHTGALRIVEGFGEEQGRDIKTADQLNNIATLYFAMEKYDLALEYFERALAIAEKLGRKDTAAIRLANIGSVYSSIRSYERAIEYYTKALAINKSLGIQKQIAVCLNNIGTVYRAKKEYSRALGFFEEAEAIAEDMGLRAEKAAILTNIGDIYLGRREYNLAMGYYKRSIDIKEELRLTAAGEVRREYLASQIYTYQRLISSAVRARLPDEALAAAEQAKARYLAEKISKGLDISELPVITAGELQKELPENEAVLIYSNVDFDKSVLILITGEEMRALEFEKKWFCDEILKRYGEEIDLVLELNRDLSLQSAKKGNEKDHFNRIVTYYRSLLSQTNPAKTEAEQRELIGRRLYDLLIKPVAGGLSGMKKLYVLPAGTLGFLPFETFIDEQGRYLVEKYTLHYMQSVTVSELISERRYAGGKSPLLAFGGAVYEASGADVNEAMIKQLSDQGELTRYNVIHFSTHGLVIPEYPELSALVLSQFIGKLEFLGGTSAGGSAYGGRYADPVYWAPFVYYGGWDYDGRTGPSR